MQDCIKKIKKSNNKKAKQTQKKNSKKDKKCSNYNNNLEPSKESLA